MELRELGKNGTKVSTLGLGCMGMSFAYGPVNDDESMKVLHRYVELGGNFLDTAEIYGPYKNEDLVGKFLRQTKRERLVIATKFGFRIVNGERLGPDSSPENVAKACEGSLKRLGIETIDLYYQHRVDPKVPIEETVGAMAQLVKEGKVRHLGLSEAGPETLRRAHAVHPITALQTEYSLWTRDPEDGVLAAARKLGVGFVAYSPLGRGFLSGQIKRIEDFEPGDVRRQHPRFQGENFAKNLQLVERVVQAAKRKGVTPSQLALAWVLAQGPDIVPIPGTKKRKYLEENAEADRIELSAEELRTLDEVAPK